MNRVELTALVSERTGLTLKQSATAISAALEVVVAALAKGETVSLHGLGTFQTRDRLPHNIVHPATGAPVLLPGSKGVRFTPAAALKRRLAESRPSGEPVSG